jgi:hypothetical protein
MALVELSNLSAEALSIEGVGERVKQSRSRQASVVFGKGPVACISFTIKPGSSYDGVMGNKLSLIFLRTSAAGLGKYATRLFDPNGSTIDGTIQAVGIQSCVDAVNASNLSKNIIARFHNESGAGTFSSGSTHNDATYFKGGRGGV